MGTKQTKEAGSESGTCSLLGAWRRTQSSLRRRSSGERLGRGGTPPPYQRRIGMIQEVLTMVKSGRQEEAMEMLKTLRQDLGMESTSLDDVLYRYASFRNLVDPITHDLIINLARYIHCSKMEGDSLSAMEKVCRQLTYHLSPHSQCRRQGLLRSKRQPSLKASLSGPPVGGTVELSGIPLCVRDMDRLAAHLHLYSSRVHNLELGFTELTDAALLQLLPTLAALPALETLALNGNRLTHAILRPLTELLKDQLSFPTLTWMDLGNNVDIFSLPQAFLLGLRKRCPKQGNLPTIEEQGEGQAPADGPGGEGSEMGSEAGEAGAAEIEHACEKEEGEEKDKEEEELRDSGKGFSDVGEPAADRSGWRETDIPKGGQINKKTLAHCEFVNLSRQSTQPPRAET